jgi:hypothetical protein
MLVPVGQLQAVVIQVGLSVREQRGIEDEFKQAFGVPQVFDSQKGIAQWRTNDNEYSIAKAPDGSGSLIALRRVPEEVVSSCPYSPEKLSSLQGIRMKMSLEDFKRSFILAPIKQANESTCVTHLFVNQEPAVASFLFDPHSGLSVISILLPLSGGAGTAEQSFSRHKAFLAGKYGEPTDINTAQFSAIWQHAGQEAIGLAAIDMQGEQSIALLFKAHQD